MNKMNELNFLNINDENYEIADKKSRDDLQTLRNKNNVVLDVSLNTSYTTESKTLSLSLDVQKGGLL